MATILFKPRQVTKKLISILNERPHFVLTRRFGLFPDAETMTLEAIGRNYGITRERVRQIENFALASIRKSPVYEAHRSVFEELKDIVVRLGGIVPEDHLLEYITTDRVAKNHVRLLLVLGEPFKRARENKEFTHRWYVDETLAERVHEALRAYYQSLGRDELVPDSEVVERFVRMLGDIPEEYKNEEIVKRWLRISKRIGQNPLGEWGVAESSNVNARGIRDYAYLVIRRHGSPLHFREVAAVITETFGRKAHVATCHNELIKDDRFVLVGRGLYALKEWGYEGGVVKDVIKNILHKNGPLSKSEIIKRVLNERYVKENTIIVNLQDSRVFKRTEDGKYTLA